MQQRPDLTARITTDDIGDVKVTITGELVGSTLTVDRADAWVELTKLATRVDRPLMVRTIDEYGHAYRDIVEPDSTCPAVTEPGDPEPVMSEHVNPAGWADAGRPATSSPVLASPVPSAMKPLADFLAAKTEPQATGIVAVSVNDTSVAGELSQEAVTGKVPRRGGRVPTGDGHDRTARINTPMAIALTVLIACVALTVVAAVAEDDPDARTADSQLPTGAAPPGFVQSDGWWSEVADGTTPGVTGNGLVALHGSDGQMRLVDPATGEVAWSGLAGDDAGSPLTDRLSGNDAVVWQQPERLLVATPAEPEPAVYETAPGARISKEGTDVLVTEPGKPGHARVLTEAGLVEVDIPDGTTAMAAVAGDVISSDGRPRLWRTPTTRGDARPVDLDGPDDLVLRRWAGVAGDTVTVVWTASGAIGPDHRAVVTAHDSTSGEPLTSATTTWDRVDDEPFTAADGREPVTAAVGPVVLPLVGKREPLNDRGARWLHHVDSRVWGVRGDGTAVVFDRSGAVTVLADGTQLPTHALAEGWALIADGAVVAALEPRDEEAES